jgi:hypothetical protein
MTYNNLYKKMSVFSTNKFTEEFLINLINTTPEYNNLIINIDTSGLPIIPSYLTRSARIDRIEYAFDSICEKTGWSDIQMSSHWSNNVFSIAVRIFNKGDYIVSYTKTFDPKYYDDYDDKYQTINVISVNKH